VEEGDSFRGRGALLEGKRGAVHEVGYSESSGKSLKKRRFPRPYFSDHMDVHGTIEGLC
jgi:hypothetical protein